MTTFSDSRELIVGAEGRAASMPVAGAARQLQCTVTFKRRRLVDMDAESMSSLRPRTYVLELASERRSNQLQNEKSLAWCLAASQARRSRIPLKAFCWAVKRASLMLGREPNRGDLDQLGVDLSGPLTTLAAVRAKQGDPETLNFRWQESTKSIAALLSHPHWKEREESLRPSVSLDLLLNTGCPLSAMEQNK